MPGTDDFLTLKLYYCVCFEGSSGGECKEGYVPLVSVTVLHEVKDNSVPSIH